ncbi:hypothetical protein FACS1894133_4560 [Clostridia bacterium]|nr:hypothetical protein FACS1894133_4560 [Clostridia bacterium]
MDEQKEKALNVALNKIQGDWDETLLASLMADLDNSAFDVSLTGFDSNEIDAMLDGFYGKNCVEDNFDEEQAKKDIEENGGAVTQKGDVWQLGEHRLICADSTLPETFEKLMCGEHAKMSMTSPPYGVNKSYEKPGLDAWFETVKPAIKNMCKHSDIVCYNIGDMMTGNGNGQFIEPTFVYSVQMFMEYGFRPIWTRIWSKKRQALSSTAPYHLSTLKPVGDTEYIAAFANESGVADEIIEVADTSFRR